MPLMERCTQYMMFRKCFIIYYSTPGARVLIDPILWHSAFAVTLSYAHGTVFIIKNKILCRTATALQCQST